jgi:hypothetical protein
MHLHITLAALARRLMVVGDGAALPHPRGADLVSGLHITVPVKAKDTPPFSVNLDHVTTATGTGGQPGTW